jgi:enoyl-CoA hydratase/carnithine racemase
VIGGIATGLRKLAQDHDAAVIVVSSVARAFYSAARAEQLRALDDPTAYLTAAKESGDVDYASAAVLFLDVAAEGEGYRNARINVAKSRHGEPGVVGARFYGASGRWEADDAAAVGLATVSASRRSKKLEENRQKILNALARNPGAAWRVIQKDSGISPYTDAVPAREALVRDGAIALASRAGSAMIYRVCGPDSTPALVPPISRAAPPTPAADPEIAAAFAKLVSP